MKVSFAVCVTHSDQREETSFHESVLDAVEDYHSSVLKSALQGWDCVVLSFASTANRWKCWRASSR